MARVPMALAVALCAGSAAAQTTAVASAPRQTQADDYTSYELLAPERQQFRILYDVTATTPGATVFLNPIRQGSEASDEHVTDMATGLASQRVSERGFQDREITYWLQPPETHAFDISHDYTETRPGTDRYVNIVRGGSRASNPGATVLDTGAMLPVETLRGDAITKAGVDIGGAVTAESEVVLVRFPAVKPGQRTRLRITETYTDPSRYGLVGGVLVWRRAFGRPRNVVVLPEGWSLTANAVPATIDRDDHGRVRLTYVNPRNDAIDVLIRAHRRPSP